MADAGLVAPSGDAELYDLEPEALRLKPYMTGDVFAGVSIRGEEGVVAIAGHPCVIRGSGGQLQRRVPCCVVGTSEPIDYADWPTRTHHLFPLSESIGIGANRAVKVLEWESVRGSELGRGRRVATLTERGIYIFQQRFTHAITRCSVAVARFEQSSKHVLREAEFEYEWVSALAEDMDDDQVVKNLVKDFHTFFDSENRRDMLRHEGGESNLRRMIHAAIREARAKRSSPDG